MHSSPLPSKRALAALAAAAIAVAGCASKATPPAATPAAPAEAAPSGAGPMQVRSTDEKSDRDRDGLADVDQAEAELARGQSELDRAFGGADASAPMGGDAQSSCDVACRAIASMRRAASAICRLAGDGDRCTHAKSLLDRSEQRVASCACSK